MINTSSIHWVRVRDAAPKNAAVLRQLLMPLLLLPCCCLCLLALQLCRGSLLP
jgi:hypothetical protein